MREIKFRVWHKEEKKYYERLIISFDEKTITVWDKHGFDFFDFDEVILEQYIGLKDKNGVEIYVGDIVKDTLGNVFTIKYNFDFKANFLYPVKDEEKFMAIYPDIWLVKLGNINENKELLENE